MPNYYPDDYKTKKDRMLEKEMELVCLIKKWWANEKYAPTMKELTEAVGFKSTSTTHNYLMSLKNKGIVTWEEKKGRTIKIVKK